MSHRPSAGCDRIVDKLLDAVVGCRQRAIDMARDGSRKSEPMENIRLIDSHRFDILGRTCVCVSDDVC